MADQVGRQLDNYRLIHLLGTGGFGEVYLAEHLYRNTQVAIKILPPLIHDDLHSFLTEARIFRLKHPNIVHVLDFGVEGRTPFIVMEYAALGTLRQRHPKGTHIPLPLLVSYAKQVASALQYAHEERLVHRDVKPENMLIGTENQVLLSDFGIATIAHGTSSQSVETMAGTIPYMAPEQIQGHPRQASDQYSLGVVIYEWLCGDHPFHGTLTEIAVQHAMIPPPSLHEKVTTIPPDVERVVMTALAKDPKQRFGSVQAFANALEQASQPKRSELRPALPVSATTDASRSQPPTMPTVPLTHWSQQVMSEIPVSPSLQSQDLVPGSNKEVSGVVSVPQSGSSPLPVQRQVSRRRMVLGLGLAGLVVTGGGLTWFLLTTASSGHLVAITGVVVSVNIANTSVTLNVNGQSIIVMGLTDQQIAVFQGQMGKTITLRATQKSDGTYTIAAGTRPTANETATATQPPASPTASVVSKLGSISFIGRVKSIGNSSLVTTAPDGQLYTMALITDQTDISAFNGTLPTVGSSIAIQSSANADGSFTAVLLRPVAPGDPNLNTISYAGITTSAVGGDSIIHFTVGIKSYSFPISAMTDLRDFSGNPQAIVSNVPVRVKVQFPDDIVIRVGKGSV